MDVGEKSPFYFTLYIYWSKSSRKRLKHVPIILLNTGFN